MSANLDWQLALSPDGTHLVVTFTVDNPTGERIYVSEAQVTPAGGSRFRAVHRLVVMNEEDEDDEPVPGAVRLVCGIVPADGNLTVLYPGRFVAVEPGARHEATYDLELPLAAWHPQGWAAPLGAPRIATLFVEIIPGEPPEWRDLEGHDGRPIRVPWAYRAALVRVASLPVLAARGSS